jgi:hypothetical protein
MKRTYSTSLKRSVSIIRFFLAARARVLVRQRRAMARRFMIRNFRFDS